MKNDCHLDLWVDCELELRLRRLAEEDDRKLSAYLRVVLQRHADHCEQQSVTKPAANSRESLSTLSDREARIARIAARVRANLQDDAE